MANSVDPDQTAPIGAVCSGSMLFAFILNSSVMLGNYLQQTTSADYIFNFLHSRYNHLTFHPGIEILILLILSLEGCTLVVLQLTHMVVK